MVIEQVKKGKSRNPGQGGRTGKSRTGVQMSKPVKKKTRTRKSLGRGSRWQQGSRTGTSIPVTSWYQDKEVPGQEQQGERLGVLQERE